MLITGGMGLPHESEAKTRGVEKPQQQDAGHNAHTPTTTVARPDKQAVLLSVALSFGQRFGVAVAFAAVKNDLPARRAEVASDGLDGDSVDSDIVCRAAWRRHRSKGIA